MIPVEEAPAKVKTCAAEVEAEVEKVHMVDWRPIGGPTADRSSIAVVPVEESDGARLEPASIVSER